MPKMLRAPAVADMVDASVSTVYRWCSEGLFPRPVKIGPRASAWIAEEVESFIAQRIAESRAPKPEGVRDGKA